MNLMTSKQMEGLSKEEQAKKAIRYMLERIRDHEHIGWYCGYGTQAFSLLTEAAATLFERPIEEVREAFLPENAKDPCEKVDA